MKSSHQPIRCAIVPPAPAAYREPLFRALHQRADLEISVIYQSASQPSWDMPAHLFESGQSYPSVRLRSWQRGRPGRTPIVWPRGLERALTEADPDVVVAWEYGPASIRALAWCRRRRRAYVVFTECTLQIDSMLAPLQLRLHRWLAANADGLIAVSAAARARLVRFGVPEARVAVALQSADVESFRAAADRAEARRSGSSHAPVVLLSVGRLVPDKNFALLLEAFARAQVGAEHARLEIVGAGFLEHDLVELATRLGVCARFRGAVAPAELPEIYGHADIYALVSTYEPFGVSIREAAAARLPIICTRTAGAAGEVAIDGRNAILVDPLDVAGVSAAVARLVADAELRRRMAVESRAIDDATGGRDVDAFATAVLAADARRGLRRR